ncbi:MAG: hypothetical protein LAT65_20085 [Saccharospirillum sp.]|nr:hypothetical protein [Saccharospirillum sp.]
MDQNKLYNALLKTQTQQRKKAEDSGQVTDDYKVERPYAKPVDAVLPDQLNDGHPPLLYDSSMSLGMINNPYPWSKKELKARKIIYPSMANKAILNAYREVRIKLRNLSEDKNFSVMVTSLSKAKGKKSTENVLLPAFNLAASFAIDAQSSALLIDCDPYHNQLQSLVSTRMGQGVTDYLDDRSINVQDIIYPSGIDRLSVVPAGTIDVSVVELFSSSRMKTLMTELKERYPDRYIVVNAPPFRVSTEARILVRYSDHAIMTVPFGEITAEDIANAIETLDTDKFAGLIYQE